MKGRPGTTFSFASRMVTVLNSWWTSIPTPATLPYRFFVFMAVSFPFLEYSATQETTGLEAAFHGIKLNPPFAGRTIRQSEEEPE